MLFQFEETGVSSLFTSKRSSLRTGRDRKTFCHVGTYVTGVYRVCGQDINGK